MLRDLACSSVLSDSFLLRPLVSISRGTGGTRSEAATSKLSNSLPSAPTLSVRIPRLAVVLGCHGVWEASRSSRATDRSMSIIPQRCLVGSERRAW